MMKPIPKLPVSVERLNLTARSLSGDRRGVTGLETTIILIAFVVVASVFAFTVLSTGIFSAERGKETIYAGLKEARSTIDLKGSVIANGVTDQALSTADSVWSTSLGATLVTVTRDTTDKKEGTSRYSYRSLLIDRAGLLRRPNRFTRPEAPIRSVYGSRLPHPPCWESLS